MKAVQGKLFRLTLMLGLVGLSTQLASAIEDQHVFQLEGPNAAAYPHVAVMPDSSCMPAFRGGDCHNCCLDLWTNYCAERRPGCGQGLARPSFGQGCGIFDGRSSGSCLSGLRHFGSGCSTGGRPLACDADTGCAVQSQPETQPLPAVQPTPAVRPEPVVRPEPAAAANEPAPEAPVEPDSAATERTGPPAYSTPSAPADPPSPAETAPVRRSSPAPADAETEEFTPAAPLPPESLHDLDVPANVLPTEESKTVDPPLPAVSMRPFTVRPVGYGSAGTVRLLKQLQANN